MKTAEENIFEALEQGSWLEVFADDCTDDWRKQWALDGKKTSIYHNEKGMEIQAGPVHLEDASHAVLWTQQSFSGDIRIEYDYTRLDNISRGVNILYIQATGSGNGERVKDIHQWAHLREVPAMKEYFNHMNLYHISYAAHEPQANHVKDDYIRARRYVPQSSGLEGTDLEPDTFSTNLFAEGEVHHFTVIKRGNQLAMRIVNDSQTATFAWSNEGLPPIEEGCIGFRHMHQRMARYANIKIYTT
ncbi:MAG: DUF1961 family protein [Verrucomicrobia bacterium]|nr:DUF1961 family protein [Verrucomicrobiota bacterium]